jgi:hypothetical protein
MVTLRARLERRKGTVAGKNHTRNKAGRRPSRQPFGKRSWKYPECKSGITGIRNHSSRQQVRLRNERTTTNGIGAWKSGQQLLLGSGGMNMKALYEMVSVKIAKQKARSSAKLGSIKEWTLWRGRPLPKRLKREPHAMRVRRAGTVGAPVTSAKY